MPLRCHQTDLWHCALMQVLVCACVSCVSFVRAGLLHVYSTVFLFRELPYRTLSPGCRVAGCCRVGLPGCRGVAWSVPGCRLLPGAGALPGALPGCCRVLPGCEDVWNPLVVHFFTRSRCRFGQIPSLKCDSLRYWSCQNSAAGQDSGFISDKLKTLRLTLAADSRL